MWLLTTSKRNLFFHRVCLPHGFVWIDKPTEGILESTYMLSTEMISADAVAINIRPLEIHTMACACGLRLLHVHMMP